MIKYFLLNFEQNFAHFRLVVFEKKAKQPKGVLGEFQIYFRKIPLHQQKFLVVSVLSN